MKRIKPLLSIILLLCFSILICCSCNDSNPETTPPIDLKIHFFNIGKADCFLIQTENKNILLDTGLSETSQTVLDRLSDLKVDAIDVLIVTHCDKDHYGGAYNICKNMTVRQAYIPNGSTSLALLEGVEAFITGNEVPCTRLSSTITINLDDGGTLKLNPTKLNAIEDENNYSIICSLHYDQFSCLFMGDALKDRVKEYMNTDSTKYDVIKLPHHGDYFNKLEEYLIQAKPKVCIMTTDEEERDVDAEIYSMASDLRIDLRKTEFNEIEIEYKLSTQKYTITEY